MAAANTYRPTVSNRKAEFQYHLLQRVTAGIVLTGTEIKSIRLGKVNLQDAYCSFQGDELFVRNMLISEYDHGNIYNHEPRRPRKLLLTSKELKKLKGKLDEQGYTIIPVKLFFSERNMAKLEIALAKGKQLFDKRQTEKERDAKREMDRTQED